MRLAFALIAMVCAVCQAEKPKLVSNEVYTADLGNATAVLSIRSHIVYVRKDDIGFYGDFAECRVFANGQECERAGNFFNVNGKAVKLDIKAPPESVFIPENLVGVFRFLKPGDVEFVFTLGDRSFEIPVRVVTADFKEAEPADKIIEAYGFPSSKKKHFVDWPDTEMIDGIIYSPKAGSSHAVEHWKFNDKPNLVISINEYKSYLYKVSSYSETKDVTLQRVIGTLRLGAMQQAREAAAQAEIVTITTRSGREIKGRFEAWSGDKFCIRDTEGKLFTVKLSLLDKPSQEKAKEFTTKKLGSMVLPKD